MSITSCSLRPILNPCSLDGITYQIDPYVGCAHYCYYCYALNQAETDWSKEIQIHDNIGSRLKKELSRIPPQKIYMGWQTDPYLPCEKAYRQTRRVLDVLSERGFSASILTKSDLVLRDLDVLSAMKDATVSTSVAFSDNRVRQLFERHTIDTEDRIRALSKLKKAGIRASALICPVVPYISDTTPLVDLLAPHADTIWVYGLSIQSRSTQNWNNIDDILKNHFPRLRQKVEDAIFSKKHPFP